MLLRLEEILMHSWECSNRTLTTQVMGEINSGPEIFVDDGDGGRETWLVDVRSCLPQTECFTCVVDENVTLFEASLQTGHYARLGCTHRWGEHSGLTKRRSTHHSQGSTSKRTLFWQETSEWSKTYSRWSLRVQSQGLNRVSALRMRTGMEYIYDVLQELEETSSMKAMKCASLSLSRAGIGYRRSSRGVWLTTWRSDHRSTIRWLVAPMAWCTQMITAFNITYISCACKYLQDLIRMTTKPT